METLEKKVQESIQKVSEKLINSEKVKRFEKATEKFNELIKSGAVTPRGNHLLSVSDNLLKNQIQFNTKE